MKGSAKASGRACGAMIAQMISGAYSVALSFHLGSWMFPVGWLLMVTAPIYVVISVKRQETTLQ